MNIATLRLLLDVISIFGLLEIEFRNTLSEPGGTVAADCARYLQAFKLHIGADFFLPTKSLKKSGPITPVEKPVHRDPFDGLPLKAWAEALGERVMPAYELIKEEQQRAKQTARATAKSAAAQIQDVEVPAIAHVLPFTRW